MNEYDLNNECIADEKTEVLAGETPKKSKANKTLVIVGIIFLGILLVSGGVFGYLTYQKTTAINTGLQTGEDLLKEGKFEESLKSFESVIIIDGENTDSIFGKARALVGLADYENAKNVFEECVVKITDLEKLKTVYNAYIDSEVTHKVSEETLFALLERAAKETGDESYIKRKGDFMIKTPAFNLNPGTYQGTQTVELVKGDPNDKIYFTTDGSEPTVTSQEYTSAIQLTSGDKTIKAIEVGANGFPSKTIEGKYTITASSEAIFQNNISGSWISRSGSYQYLYYFKDGYCSYISSYGSSSSSTSTANYTINGVNSAGTIATLSLFNIQGSSLPSTMNINCEPLGDNMISINQKGYTYQP